MKTYVLYKLASGAYPPPKVQVIVETLDLKSIGFDKVARIMLVHTWMRYIIHYLTIRSLLVDYLMAQRI